MASFQKNLQKFFVYFFTGVSVIIVVLGIQRVKQSDNLGTTAVPDDKGGFANKDGSSSNTTTRVAGAVETITAQGDAYQTPWGNLATTIKVVNGKITAVDIPQLPDSPPSIQAKAYLIDQALRSGSSDIQGVSGATITSRAFKASLESAIAQALAQRATTVAEQNGSASTVSTTAKTETPVVTTSTTQKTTSTQTSTQTQNTATQNVSGVFTGNAYQTPWGNTVASVTFTNGTITSVSMPQVPNSPPSIQAKPYLIDQALKSGGANIQGVSGATYVSIAFKSSLESAIAKAGSQGTVVTPTPSTTTTTQASKPSIPRTYHDDDDDDEHDKDRNDRHHDDDDDDEWDDD